MTTGPFCHPCQFLARLIGKPVLVGDAEPEAPPWHCELWGFDEFGLVISHNNGEFIPWHRVTSVILDPYPKGLPED